MFNWFKKTAAAVKSVQELDVATTQGDDSVTQLAISESEALKNQGNVHFDNGKLEDAAECYRSAIARNPYYAEAYTNLGRVFQAQGNLDEAVALYRKAIVFKPNLLQAHQNLGAALISLGQTDAAEESLQRVIALVPEHSGALMNLGIIAAQRGDFPHAETLLRRALELRRDYAETHYNLGNLLREAKRLPEAEASYRRALELNPDYAEAHYNLGATLHGMGRMDEAEASYHRTLELKPDYVETHYNLGFLLMEAKRLPEAEASYRRALELKPDYVEVHFNLGNLLMEAKRLPEAVTSYRRALELKPDYVEAHYNLGFLLMEAKRLPEAETSYHRTLELKPDYVETHYNLGFLLMEAKRLPEAEASYRRALELKPDYVEAHNNLGLLLMEAKRLPEAEASYHRALELKPDYVEVHFNLGNLLMEAKRLPEAVTSYRRALELKPDFAAVHVNLGNALKGLGQLDSAVMSYHRAVEIKPDYADAHNNLGTALQVIGQLDSAVTSYRRALEIKPDFAEVHSNILFTLNYHPDMSAEDIYRAYQEYDASFGIPLRSTWRVHGNDKNLDRRLRVGYVSPDFRRHSGSSVLEPLLAHHDKTQVEVYAYAELAREDEVTVRFQSHVEHWIATKGMSDATLAERIRSDGIDILVELAGHTAGNRLLAFARKPAPVSVSWLGYGYTTGLGAIDYYLTDDACAPAGSEQLFAEQPWRMDTIPATCRPKAGMGEVNGLPAPQRGHITFGTLSRSIRINHRTVRVWAKILRAVPGSRLVIDSLNFKDPAMQERMAARFAEHGIARGRLEIGFHSPPWDVLRGIDIGLDCFPHNSGTTLFESLYMGVPYITLAGRPSVGRLGSSILQSIGHPEWIAETEDEYVAKAIELASDVMRLSEIRATLREQIESSSLRDEAGFARKVEAAYRGMWKDWCERDHGQPG